MLLLPPSASLGSAMCLFVSHLASCKKQLSDLPVPDTPAKRTGLSTSTVPPPTTTLSPPAMPPSCSVPGQWAVRKAEAVTGPGAADVKQGYWRSGQGLEGAARAAAPWASTNPVWDVEPGANSESIRAKPKGLRDP